MPKRNEIEVTDKEWLSTRIAIAHVLRDLARLETAAKKPGFTPKHLYLWCEKIRQRFTSLDFLEEK